MPAAGRGYPPGRAHELPQPPDAVLRGHRDRPDGSMAIVAVPAAQRQRARQGRRADRGAPGDGDQPLRGRAARRRRRGAQIAGGRPALAAALRAGDRARDPAPRADAAARALPAWRASSCATRRARRSATPASELAAFPATLQLVDQRRRSYGDDPGRDRDARRSTRTWCIGSRGSTRSCCATASASPATLPARRRRDLPAAAGPRRPSAERRLPRRRRSRRPASAGAHVQVSVLDNTSVTDGQRAQLAPDRRGDPASASSSWRSRSRCSSRARCSARSSPSSTRRGGWARRLLRAGADRRARRVRRAGRASSTRWPASSRSARRTCARSACGWSPRCAASARRSPRTSTATRCCEIVVRTAVDGVGGEAGRATVRPDATAPLRGGGARRATSSGLEEALQRRRGARARDRRAAEARSVDERHALAHPLRGRATARARVTGIVSVGRARQAVHPTASATSSTTSPARRRVSVENVGLHETVERQAVTDELTGLSNRRRFQEALAPRSSARSASARACGLVMLDIDDFKQVNDTYGHQQGDVVLREVARVLRESSREIDEPARYGGEELAVVLPGHRPRGRLRPRRARARGHRGARAAARGRRAASGDAADHGEPRRGRAAGVGTRTCAGSCAAADAALYGAKRAGKNRTVPGRAPSLRGRSCGHGTARRRHP